MLELLELFETLEALEMEKEKPTSRFAAIERFEQLEHYLPFWYNQY